MAKKDIHPKYYPNAKIKCNCGNEFIAGSTKENLEVEVCSACHPVFTGKQKILDTMGQIQKFKNRVEKSSQIKKNKG